MNEEQPHFLSADTALASATGTRAKGTLALRAIQAPPGRLVAVARPAYVSAEAKARAASWAAANAIGVGLRALAPRARRYKGARWTYDLHTLARVDAHAEQTRRARRRVWYTRPNEKPFRLGLDRILPRAIAGLAAVST